VEEVRGHLQKLWEQRDAYAVTEMDSGFIRANAPRWKEVNTWLETDNKGAVDMEAMEEKAIEGIVRELGIKYAKTLTVKPDRFLEAIKRLYQEELGRPIDIRNLTPGEAEEGGLECDF
jgi:hypothetical protein